MGKLSDLSRSDFSLEANQLFDIPLTAWRIFDDLKTPLGITAISDDDLAISDSGLSGIAGTHGTNFPFITTLDVKNASKTRKARCQIRLPYNYAAGQNVAIWCEAGMKTTVASSSATLAFAAYTSGGTSGTAAGTTGGTSGQLVQTSATSINSLTWTTLASQSSATIFAIDGTNLKPGDMLDILATIAVVDSATIAAVIAGFRAALACTTRG